VSEKKEIILMPENENNQLLKAVTKPKTNAPKITVAISVEGEQWTRRFKSWVEAIEYLEPYAAEPYAAEKKEINEGPIKETTNKHDKDALDLLKLFKRNVDGMIECMEDGDAYNPGAIGGIIDIGLLLTVRDELVRARMED